MKYVNIHEIISQVSPFIGSQYTQGEADQGPQVNRLPGVIVLFGHIMNLGVHPAYRRQGLGRALMRHLLQSCSNSAIESVYLEVRVSNASAIAMYQSLGFQQIGRIKGY